MPPQRQPAAKRRTAKARFLASRGMGASGVPARLRAGWNAQGKKVRRSSCGKAVEAQPSSGQTAINRGHRGCPNPEADRSSAAQEDARHHPAPVPQRPGHAPATPGTPQPEPAPSRPCAPPNRAAGPARPPSPEPSARPTRCHQPPRPKLKRQGATPGHRLRPGTPRQPLNARQGSPRSAGATRGAGAHETPPKSTPKDAINQTA